MTSMGTLQRAVAAGIICLALCPMAVRAAGDVAAPDTAPAATQPVPASQPDAPLADVAAATSAVVEATRQLASGNFAARQAAHSALQKALAQQLAAILMITDTEAAARGRGVVRFESTTAAWALGVFGTVSRENARQAISFAFSPEVSPLMVDVTGDDPQLQHNALAKLVATNDPRVPAFLATIISSPDQNRACVAIDLAWRLQPSQPLLIALWTCASRGMFVPDFRTANNRPSVAYVGDHLQFQISAPYRTADLASEYASHLLAHWKDPRTAVPFSRSVKHTAQAAVDGDPESHWEIRLKQRQFIELAEAFKSQEAVTLAATAAIGEQTWKVGGIAVNSRATTNRTQMIGLLSVLTQQDPAAYLLTNSGFAAGQINWSAANLADEEQAVKKARAWWAEHQSEYPVLVNQPSARASDGAAPGRTAVKP